MDQRRTGGVELSIQDISYTHGSHTIGNYTVAALIKISIVWPGSFRKSGVSIYSKGSGLPSGPQGGRHLVTNVSDNFRAGGKFNVNHLICIDCDPNHNTKLPGVTKSAIFPSMCAFA